MSTIILVRHQVADYSTWRPGFNAHMQEAQKYGFTAISVLRDNTYQNNITVLLQARDLNLAKTFLNSAEAREMMHTDGVIGKPEIHYLKDATRG